MGSGKQKKKTKTRGMNSVFYTYLSYTNNELLPLMDSPDIIFSKTQFKSIKYFNKSCIFTSKLYRKFFHFHSIYDISNQLIINSHNYCINSTHYTPFPRLIAKKPVVFICAPGPEPWPELYLFLQKKYYIELALVPNCQIIFWRQTVPLLSVDDVAFRPLTVVLYNNSSLVYHFTIN